MKKKYYFISILFLLLIPAIVFGEDISIGFNEFMPGAPGEPLENFFKNILQGILNLIALLAIVFIVIAGIIYLMASSSGNDRMVETAKKIWAGSLVGLALSAAAPTFIKQILAILGDEILTDPDNTPTLSSILNETLTFLLSIIGILAIIGITINSILMLTAGGDSSKFEKAKKGFNFSLLGLIVAGSALILVRLVVDLIQG